MAVLFSAALYAQQNLTISGKVVAASNGNALSGVTVTVKGTPNGTATDEGGHFIITAPRGAILVFSSVGFQKTEVTANNSNLNIQLIAADKGLDEVVVIGYGSKRKRDITAAVSNINLDDQGELPSRNVTQMIQGQAPGVVATQRNGTPGAEFEVRIRGIGSIGAGSNPLYVIDGFAVGTSVGQNLNPNDIQSISILKDAAATAIYGARGSNGVVLITTKSAKEGQTNLNLSVDYGVQNIPKSRRVKVLNGPEFAQFLKDVYSDKIRYFENREPSIDEIPEGYRYPEQTKYSTDWFNEILHNNAPYTDVNLTLSSGKGDINSLLSFGYYKEEGALKNTGYDRFSARANISGKVRDFITLGLNVNGSYTRQDIAATDGRDAVVGSSLLVDPREPAYDENGNIRPFIGGKDGVFAYPSPLFLLYNYKRHRDIADVLSNAYIEVAILKNLKFRSSLNVKLNYNTYKEYKPSTIGRGLTTGTTGAPPQIATAAEINDRLLNYSADQLLTYTPNIGEDHKLDFLAGFTSQEETVKQIRGDANTFPDDLTPFLNAGAIRSSSSLEYTWALIAYIARANYSFKDKYLISGSFRREGSSRFSKGYQYGDFPSASIGWRISGENFMSNVSWLTDLKLRASYGKTGNSDIPSIVNSPQGVGNYISLPFLTTSGYILNNSFAPGVIVSSFANKSLQWEKSDQTNIGLDMAILNNRVTLTAEYYNKLTNDMLLPVSIPAVSGFTSSYANVGQVRNRGVEIAVGYNERIGKLNLRTSGNIAFNRSRVMSINGANDILWYGSFYGGYNVNKVGRPIGMIYGYDKIGIFNTQDEIDHAPKQDGVIPGGMKFRDADSNGEITYDTKDMVEIGNPNPKFTWGLTIDMDYKGFDFNILFMGAQDFDVYRNIEASTMNMDGVFNVLDKAKDRWRSAENPGTNPTDVHAQGGTNYFKWSRESSNRYVYDASYGWVKAATLGYTFAKTRYFNNIRVFVGANNLFIITNYPGNNPDVSQRSGTQLGNDDEAYPVPRTFFVGAKFNF
ncbi:MAG: SusC/RagA family TonB-linked outer membrane protein [Sphingobacteriales bacterium 40-81]|nr:MAG: SusC/RagA family TonB-linked outer membrane protein [Sphingobacteriales bacterium 40-81]